MKPDFSIFLADYKVAQFLADKVVLFLTYLILAFVILDSFIHLIPNGDGSVIFFIGRNGVTSGQQSYVNEYCADHARGKAYMVPILIFGQSLVTILLHHFWYSMVLYFGAYIEKTKKVAKKENTKVIKTDFDSCLLQFVYIFKNGLQLFFALIAVVLSLLYKFGNKQQLFDIDKNFVCSVDELPELGTVRCLYSSIALNDVFIIFYLVVTVCVIIVTMFGFVDICARRDLDKKEHKCCCRGCLKNCFPLRENSYPCWLYICSSDAQMIEYWTAITLEDSEKDSTREQQEKTNREQQGQGTAGNKQPGRAENNQPKQQEVEMTEATIYAP